MSLYERLSKARGDESDVSAPQQGDQQQRPVDPLADLKRKTHQALVAALGPKLYDIEMTPQQLEAKVRQQLTEVLEGEDYPLSASERQRLIAETTDDILGYGPLEAYLRDPNVTEVMVNGPNTLYIEREGKILRTSGRFHDDAHLRQIIEKIVGRVGRRIDESSPYVDARLPDGSRVNAAIPPIAIDGAALTIRKFSREPYQIEDLISFGTVSSKVARFLEACVKGRINMLVSGGTGAGKTSTLNVLSSFIPADERILTIEDSAELRMMQPHVVRMESRPPNIEGRGEVTIRDLVRNALRMRPDRIVVGEVRSGEALDMLQAMNTGHDGSISTVHANTPRDVLSRLETMCLMAGMDLPVRAIREQIASAIQLVVHQARLKDGSRRVTHVTEVSGMEGDVITMQDLFLFDMGMGVDEAGKFRGHIKSLGLRPHFMDRLEDYGIKLGPEIFEPEPMARDGFR
ncbi:MAG: CpaF family protein [Actinomycetota bacterium]|nr:CpaF family protein [Actinomycetota bacterium]